MTLYNLKEKKCNCPSSFSSAMSKKLYVQCQCLKRAVPDLSRESLESADTIVDIKRNFLSECNLVRKEPLSPRKSSSEPNIHYTVDYDDLCGPWPSPDHPTFKQYDDVTLRPMLCTWKFITVPDMKCMRQHLFDKNAIKFIIEKKLPDNVIFQGKGRKIFVDFAWEIFKYMRDNNFNGKAVSSMLGILYSTHRFFLSNYWRTACETHSFFNECLGLHAFLKPPESDLVFDYSECDKLLDLFETLYIQKLELVRLACIPKCKLLLKLNRCCTENHEQLLVSDSFETQM